MDALRRHGVDTIFGYPGGAILPIYDALHIAESEGWVKHILVRHEQAGTHAADAYARATGKVGVCFGTSGPGATNLVTGIATAQMDSVPMVVITGQVPRPAIGTDAFQETDIFGITLPIVKHSWVVRDPADLASIVAQAFLIAASGRPGPVLIDIPKDVGQEMFDYVPVEPGSIVPKGFRKPQPPRDEPILSALELIAEAERPLLYLGGGAISAGAHDSLRVIAERYQIPVTTTLMGKGAFDENDPLSVGMLGMHGTAYANFAVTECDLLIAVGARFDDRVTGKLDTFAPRAQVIHFEIDPAEIGKTRRPDVAVLGDLGLSVARLVELSTAAAGATPHVSLGWHASLSGNRPIPSRCLPPKAPSSPRRCYWPCASWPPMPSSPRTWASTRCGRPSTCAMGPGAGSAVPVSAPWASACRPQWAPRWLAPIVRWCASQVTPAS